MIISIYQKITIFESLKILNFDNLKKLKIVKIVDFSLFSKIQLIERFKYSLIYFF